MKRHKTVGGGWERIPPEERFWEKVEKTVDGCWLWRGPIRSNGYGYTTDYWTKILAHRFAWELTVGPISEGKKVLHRCDVRNCVNPDHLWIGTQKENMDDARAKGRMNYTGPRNPCRGEDSPRAVLTEWDVREIRRLYTPGRVGRPSKLDPPRWSVRDLAEHFGVSSSLIHNIVTRKAWKHID